MSISAQQFLQEQRENPPTPETCSGCGSPMEPDDGVRYRIIDGPIPMADAPAQGDSANGETARPNK